MQFRESRCYIQDFELYCRGDVKDIIMNNWKLSKISNSGEVETLEKLELSRSKNYQGVE